MDEAAVIEAIQAGGMGIFPTETLWSLSCMPDATPVSRLRMAKQRPVSVPLALGVLEVADVVDHVRLSAGARRLAEALLPGPVSIVVDRTSDRFQSLAPDRTSLSLRVPDHEIARRILAATGPLVMTSANEHGAPDPITRDDVMTAMPGVACVGDRVPGTASTVVDATGSEPVVLRQGAVDAATILAAWQGSA